MMTSLLAVIASSRPTGPILSTDYAIQGRLAGGNSPATTSHSISMPEGVVPGELLLAITTIYGSPTIGATPAGWRLLNTQTIPGVLTQGWYWKVATGSDALTLTTDSAVLSSFNTFRITGYDTVRAEAGTAPFSGGNNASSGASVPDPPATNMGFFGYTVARPFLFIAVVSQNGGGTTAGPSGYGNHITSPISPPTSSADRLVTTLLEDPGAFTGPASQWAAATLVIFPAS